jgi:hypothetical protein
MKVYMGPYKKDGKDRKIEVRVDNYDVWSVDCTLAEIIVPVLKKFRANMLGGKPTPKQVDEMIWAFEQTSTEEYFYEGFDVKRFDGALRLFAKFYRGLWT